jgi:hypothetical protein
VDPDPDPHRNVMDPQHWVFPIHNSQGLVDYFDIDSAVGRDVVFQLDLRTTAAQQRSADDCQQNITVSLIAPDEDHTRTNLSFRCDAENFGVFRHSLEGLAAEGRWVYLLRTEEDYSSLSVLVTSKGRSDDPTEPILTRCWVSADGGAGESRKLAVVAEVRKGQRPVIGATVQAMVERPSTAGGQEEPALQFRLLDNGGGQLLASFLNYIATLSIVHKLHTR